MEIFRERRHLTGQERALPGGTAGFSRARLLLDFWTAPGTTSFENGTG